MAITIPLGDQLVLPRKLGCVASRDVFVRSPHASLLT